MVSLNDAFQSRHVGSSAQMHGHIRPDTIDSSVLTRIYFGSLSSGLHCILVQVSTSYIISEALTESKLQKKNLIKINNSYIKKKEKEIY